MGKEPKQKAQQKQQKQKNIKKNDRVYDERGKNQTRKEIVIKLEDTKNMLVK